MFEFKIKAFIFDLDGTLTNGDIITNSKGITSRQYNVKDFVGLIKLHEYNPDLFIACMTGSSEKDIEYRFKKFPFIELFLGCPFNKKLKILNSLCMQKNILLKQVAYIGDDTNDYECLKNVGLTFCPKNSVKQIKDIEGIFITNKDGGDGVIREVTDYIIEYNL